MSRGSVVVAMSGGVDSSVAALLLRRAGYDVTGLFMRTGASPARGSRTCCSLGDSRDAGRVADLLEIPFYRLDFEAAFSRIVDYFVDEYRSGRTPNPCIACNRDLKFGKLLEYANAVGATHVATGHYAGIRRGDGRLAVRRGRDRNKDQSYVLFPLSQRQLGRTLLPLGDLAKSEVREIARDAGLPVSEKAESQEICFVPPGGHGAFIEERGGLTAGPLLDLEGREIGRHAGFEVFTIGQRKGLGKAFGEPRYVVAIDPARAAVTVGGRADLLGREFRVRDWVGSAMPTPEAGEEIEAEVKVRYRHRAAPAGLRGMGGGRMLIRFREPQSAVTPGQGAVAYDGNRVLGGGWIESRATG